jgi:hypothetical protein
MPYTQCTADPVDLDEKVQLRGGPRCRPSRRRRRHPWSSGSEREDPTVPDRRANICSSMIDRRGRTPGIVVRCRGPNRTASVDVPVGADGPGLGCVGRSPAELDGRCRPPLRTAGRGGALAVGAPIDVRPGGRRSPAGGVLRQRGRAAQPFARRCPSRPRGGVPRRCRLRVRVGGPVSLPRRPGQRGLARGHHRTGATDDVLVAIVSLGAPRSLLLRPIGGGATVRFRVGAGDLLVMGGSCQRTWEHAVPKTARPVGPRISVQFRPPGVR